MNESFILQLLHFISECKTEEEIKKREFHHWRLFGESTPKQLLEAIEKQRSTLNENENPTTNP